MAASFALLLSAPIFVLMDDFFDALLHWTVCYVSIGETMPFLSATSVSAPVDNAKPVHAIHYSGLPSFPDANVARKFVIGDEREHNFPFSRHDQTISACFFA